MSIKKTETMGVDAVLAEKKAHNRRVVGRLAMGVAIALYAGFALAIGATNDTSDPMGSGMCYFVNMITGKWAFALSVVAFAATAFAFLGGVEMNEFMKKVTGTFMVVTFILAATNIAKGVATFFGNSSFC